MKESTEVTFFDEFYRARKRTIIYTFKMLLGVSMKTVTKSQVIDHGIDNCQYFPGCGVVNTEYESCYTGIGDNAYAALEDALDNAAQDDWYVDGIQNTLSNVSELPEDETGETHYYVSIRLK